MLSYIKLNAFHFDLIKVSQEIKVREKQLSVEQNERNDFEACFVILGYNKL